MSEERWASFWLAVAVISMAALWFFLAALRPAHGQQSGHTHEGELGKFYSTWMMPDAPRTSCCSNLDCAPAASRFINGHWEAEFEGEWTPIPPQKIEQNRDSPDGRSHVCGRKNFNGTIIFCFIRGGGA